MSELKLREFVCKYCGHSVVVRPDLPDDYTPNVCGTCAENRGLKERQSTALSEILVGAEKLFKLMGIS
jgi:DNA-directed RNA polymerase subunit RPC12/RpoP